MKKLVLSRFIAVELVGNGQLGVQPTCQDEL